MSYHCVCDDSTADKPWAHVHVASIHGGIPITFVVHLNCLRKMLCENTEGPLTILKEGCESLDESFQDLIDSSRDHTQKKPRGEN